jgi:hypothetical protein
MRTAAGAALALAFAAIFAGLAAEPHRRREPPGTAHYPLEAGLRWVYHSSAVIAVVREIPETVEHDGLRYHLLRYRLPLLGRREIPMRHSAEGVVGWHGGREYLLIRFPMRRGDRWTVDWPAWNEIAECEVVGEEEVEFLGRRGRATRLRVVRIDRASGRRTEDAEWYAEGLGLVRMHATYGIPMTFTLSWFERAARPR